MTDRTNGGNLQRLSNTYGANSIRVVQLDELGRLVRAKRWAENLTLVQAAKQIGVSAATLSRLERSVKVSNGRSGGPDVRTLTAITNWLGVSVSEVLNIEQDDAPFGKQVGISSNTIEVINAYLRADKNLDPVLADDLATLVRAVYEHFVRQPTLENAGSDAPYSAQPRNEDDPAVNDA